jgi:hypothetical protein
MISTNIDEVIKDLQAKIVKIESKLTGMVKSFIYNITVEAIDITPFGSSEYVTADGEIKENVLYNLPQRQQYYLYPRPGHAKGGWLYSFGYLPSAKPRGYPADGADASDIKSERKSDLSKYKLGQSVYLFNAVPYVATDNFTLPGMRSLEDGYSDQAPSGISGPLTSAIMQLYNQDLPAYYKESE